MAGGCSQAFGQQVAFDLSQHNRPEDSLPRGTCMCAWKGDGLWPAPPQLLEDAVVCSCPSCVQTTCCLPKHSSQLHCGTHEVSPWHNSLCLRIAARRSSFYNPDYRWRLFAIPKYGGLYWGYQQVQQHALFEKQAQLDFPAPLQCRPIHCQQHFCTTFQRWACIGAAPVVDMDGPRPILGISIARAPKCCGSPAGPSCRTPEAAASWER